MALIKHLECSTGSTAASDASIVRCVASFYLNVLSASGKGLVLLPLRDRKKPTDKNRNACPANCADVCAVPKEGQCCPCPARLCNYARALLAGAKAAAVKFPQFPPVPLPFKPFLMPDPCSRISTATALAHPQRARV